MSYRTDKKKFVTFGNHGQKAFLHRYVQSLAKKIAFKTGGSQFDHKKLLIKYYNIDGMEGLNRVMKIKLDK